LRRGRPVAIATPNGYNLSAAAPDAWALVAGAFKATNWSNTNPFNFIREIALTWRSGWWIKDIGKFQIY